jgi:hypothetical protein
VRSVLDLGVHISGRVRCAVGRGWDHQSLRDEEEQPMAWPGLLSLEFFDLQAREMSWYSMVNVERQRTVIFPI